jgi:hypothetical protein
MRSAWFRRLAITAVAGLAMAGSTAPTVGCAGTRDEINRVQPLAIKKADLVGDFRDGKDAPEFYMRSVILEVQRTNPWFSDGLQDLTRRVRFEVTENFLIARNAYEYIKGGDGKGGVKGKSNNGLIVAVYPITKHFNVQRSYNPATGEDTNVIEENTSDRPWFEREYMRVDWSRNLIDDPNQIFWYDSWSGDLGWKNVAFFESDPKKAEDIQSNFNELDKGYFDVTSRWIAGPMTFDYYGYQIPVCLIKGSNLYPGTYPADPSIECNDQEVTLRTAFSKVPVGENSTDYEVAPINKWEGNIMGNLTMDRSGYDRQYGIVDDTWHTYIMRYNIWQKSHLAGSVCGQTNNQAKGDEDCRGAHGVNSTCDLNVKECTIPLTDRKVRPIAFFADPALPQAMYPATQFSVDQWNYALKSAVSYAREAECRKSGTDRDTCHLKFFAEAIDPKKPDAPTGDDVVVMCHNPVIKGDNAACGAEGKKVRKGDIREHMIAWWNNPSFNRPLGVIVWSGDPTTGENIGSLVNVFGASVEVYTARFRDTIMLINGDLTPTEYTSGLTRQWYGGQPGIYENDPVVDPALNSYSYYLKNTAKKAMGADEIKSRLHAVDVALLKKTYGADKALAAAATDVEKLAAWGQYVQKQSTEGTGPFKSPQAYAAAISKRVENAQKAGLESKVVNDIWTSSIGIDPKGAQEKPVLDAVSPFRGMNPTAMKMADVAAEDLRNRMHMCQMEGPEMLRVSWQAGFAAKLKAKYPDGAVASGDAAKRAGVEGQTIDRRIRGLLIFHEMVMPMYEHTLLHEMGHLMSMEHDFSGSWDAPNFYPEYWTLRANANKASMVDCKEARADGSPDTCMSARFMDPVTPEELGVVKGKEHDSIDAYAVSSVMDYKFDTYFEGRLAPMDLMAAKFIYTRIVELFDDAKHSLVATDDGKVKTVANQFTGALNLMNAEAWYIGGKDTHYTELGRKLNLFDPNRCRPQTPEEKDKGIGVLGLVCQIPHKDHAFLRDMTPVTPGGFPAGEDWQAKYAKLPKDAGYGNADDKFRWAYKVGDGRTSYVHQYVYDNGADIYELTQDILERYEIMYLDYFYRMGSRERNINNAGYAMFGRFFDRIQALQWNVLSDVVRNASIDPEAGSLNERAGVLALTMLFDGMQNSLLRPQPGEYVLNKQPGSLYDVYSAAEGTTTSSSFKLGVGEGRYIDHNFDLSKQFDYRAYAYRSGSFLEKPFAGIALTDARPQLSTVARETYLDGRNVMYSFRSAIPQAFDRLVAGVFADDWDTVAPWIDPSKPVNDMGMSPMSVMHLWESDPTKLVRPAGAKLIDPMLGQRIKVPAIILMMLYFPADTNMELIQRTRVWVSGGVEAITIPEKERVVFYDPVEGLEWNAKTFGIEKVAGKSVDVGIGARMLQHANELMTAAYNVETQVVDVTTGQLTVKYGPDNRPMKKGGGTLTAADVKDPRAVEKLRQYVGFLGQVRYALLYLGFGPCGYDRDC